MAFFFFLCHFSRLNEFTTAVMMLEGAGCSRSTELQQRKSKTLSLHPITSHEITPRHKCTEVFKN